MQYALRDIATVSWLTDGHHNGVLRIGLDGEGTELGSPADPNTGRQVRATDKGPITVVTYKFNQPTSLEIKRNAAYVVTLGGEIWQTDHIACRSGEDRMKARSAVPDAVTASN